MQPVVPTRTATPGRRRAVERIDPVTGARVIYISAKQASESVGGGRCGVSNRLSNQSEVIINGYRFRYLESSPEAEDQAGATAAAAEVAEPR